MLCRLKPRRKHSGEENAPVKGQVRTQKGQRTSTPGLTEAERLDQKDRGTADCLHRPKRAHLTWQDSQSQSRTWKAGAWTAGAQPEQRASTSTEGESRGSPGYLKLEQKQQSSKYQKCRLKHFLPSRKVIASPRYPSTMGSSPPDHLAISAQHIATLRAHFAQHTYEPLALSPYRSAGTLLLAAYLLLPLRPSSPFVRNLRFPVWLFYTASCIDSLIWTRTSSHGVAYIIGAAFAFGPMWTATLLVFRDARREARRVERRRVVRGGERDEGVETTGRENGAVDSRGLHKRKPHASPSAKADADSDEFEYFWQPLPPDLPTRLNWVVDLGLALRGAGWAHQIRTLPGPPPRITATLPSPPRSSSATAAPRSRAAVLRRELTILATRYLLIDALKVLAMHDPYFLSLGAAHPLPPSFPAILADSPWRLRVARSLAVFALTRCALELVYASVALSCLCLLPSHVLGLRGEPWYYPAFYGPVSAIPKGGLAGFWGTYWHQLLRLGLETPGAAIVRWLGWERRKALAKLVSVALAFACSGMVHWSASHLSAGVAHPTGTSLAFFALQVVGLVGETALKTYLKRSGVAERVPRIVRESLNFLGVAAWLLATSPLFADDVAGCGVFLFEPVAISVVRMAGFGGADGRWWRWQAHNVFWHSDKEHWYKSGLAI